MTGDRQDRNRVNLVEAKNIITKKIGPVQAEKYFNLMTRFLSKKLSISDFHKLCIVAVGRENISLHNTLIKSILNNATYSTMPPPNPTQPEVSAIAKPCTGYRTICLQALIPKPPRKGRTPVVHEKRQPPTLLGPQATPETVASKEQQSSIENMEEVDQSAGIRNKRPRIAAPFGVQYRPEVTQIRPPMVICQSNGELPDTLSLMTSLVQRLKDQGISVPLEFANVLNLSLDVYLKKVCEPCVQLAKAQASARASLIDLRVAMELNATVLGENRPLHLETVNQQQDLEMKEVYASVKYNCSKFVNRDL